MLGIVSKVFKVLLFTSFISHVAIGCASHDVKETAASAGVSNDQQVVKDVSSATDKKSDATKSLPKVKPKAGAATASRGKVGGATAPTISGVTTSAATPAVVPAAKKSENPPSLQVRTVTKTELAALKALNEKYRTTKSAQMDVTKVVKLGLIGGERRSSGTLKLSSGQLRMELEGAEKTMLLVNKTNLWAVTYPPKELKDAALQVIRGETNSKKTQGQALTGLLGAGGFLKSFKPTGLQSTDAGDSLYFLQPLRTGSEFKRAQLLVSKDGKEIRELRFWDERDNETSFSFSNVEFGKKLDASIFNYTPPANADVMNL